MSCHSPDCSTLSPAEHHHSSDGEAPSFRMEEEAVASDQNVVANANRCKELVPEIEVPMEEEALARDQELAKDVKQCNEMEPKFADREEEGAAVACTPSVVIAEPCKVEMKPEVAVPMEAEAEEAVACDQADTAKQSEVVMEFRNAVPKEEAILVACDKQVAHDTVTSLAPGTAKECKLKDPEAVVLQNEVYLTIEDCTGKLPLSLTAANGDGDDDGGGNGGTSIVSNGVVNGCKVTEQGSSSKPISEVPVEICVAPEPSWGDVRDEPVAVSVPMEKTPRSFPKRQRPTPENVEVDDVVQTMRNILMDLRNVDDARLHPDDDTKVRSLLEYHPQAQEKMGSGVDYIKIKRHSTFHDVRCFWVVRTDGTETDFSYHKCLKEKVAQDHPNFFDRYDAIYRAPKRPRRS